MKNYSLQLLPSVEDDLFEIWLYIAQDSTKQADRWIDLLQERVSGLKDFPEKGRPYKNEYRILTANNGYRIYYRIDETAQSVIVAHFFSPYQNKPD